MERGGVVESPEVDLIYQVLKQAGEISNSKARPDNCRTDVKTEDRTPVGILVNDRNSSAGTVAASSAPGSSGSSGQSLNRRVQPQRPASSSLTVNNPLPNSTVSGLSRYAPPFFVLLIRSYFY